jgi:hypothetical protein
MAVPFSAVFLKRRFALLFLIFVSVSVVMPLLRLSLLLLNLMIPLQMTLSVSRPVFEKLMAASSLDAFRYLVSWCDEVEFVRVRTGDSLVVFRFRKSDDFFRWRDWILNAPLTFTYVRRFDDVVVVTVPLLSFIQGLSAGKVWRVSTQRK